MELITVFDEQVCRRVLLPRALHEKFSAMKHIAQHNLAAATADSGQRTADSKRRRPAACPNGSCLQVYAVTKTRAVQLSGSAFQISHARCGMLVCWAPKFPEGLLEGQLALLGRNGSRI